MNKVIKLTLELRLDCEKCRLVKVKPYFRVRNGKKELVKGYTKKIKGL